MEYNFPQVPVATSSRVTGYQFPEPPKPFPHEVVDQQLIKSATSFYTGATGEDLGELMRYYQQTREMIKKQNTVEDPDGLRKLSVAMYLRKRTRKQAGRKRKTRRSKLHKTRSVRS